VKAIYSIFLVAVPLLAHSSPSPEPIVGGCEDCRNKIIDWPATPQTMITDQPVVPPTHARIGSIDEPGEPMHIQGSVTDTSGTPRSGVVVYAFQANNEGVHVLTANRRLALRGWALTDARGRYSFDTIRPGNVAKNDPAHIHFFVREVGRCVYYIDDVVFTDDPHLTETRRQKTKDARGGSGIVSPSKDSDGVWQATRDIKLGLNIPGYEHCKPRQFRQSLIDALH